MTSTITAINLVPPNGSVISREVGSKNVSVQCDIIENNIRTYSLWHLENYHNIKGLQGLTSALGDQVMYSGYSTSGGALPTYRNVLLIKEFTADLHNTTLYCGSGSSLKYAVFYLKKYSKCIIINSYYQSKVVTLM